MEPEVYNNSIKPHWKLFYNRLSDNKRWIAIHVATGRKFWPLFTFEPNIELGINDPQLENLQRSFKYYTFPVIDTFVNELNIELSLIYETEIKLLSKR